MSSNVRALPSRTESVAYVPAAIHEGVRVTDFAAALHRAGLTFSNVPGRGLVIHKIGQDPTRPAPPFTEEPA